MFNKLIFSGLCAATMLLFTAGTAEATFIGSILTNGENAFEDQNREAYVDVNSNMTFDVGDVLLGFVRLDDQTSAGGIGPLTRRVFSIFSQEVASIVGTTVTFAPTTVAGLTLSALTGAAMPAGSMSAIYSGPVAITDLITTSPGDLNLSGTTNLFDYLLEITSGLTLSVVTGFGAGPTEADDFFLATVGAPFLAAGGTALIPLTPGSITIGGFDAGLSILFNADAGTVIYNEAVLSLATGAFTTHQLVVGSGTIRGASGSTNVSEWSDINPDSAHTNPGGFITDADFFVNTTVVPEPTSMVLFGLGSIAFGIAGLRRRKKARSA